MPNTNCPFDGFTSKDSGRAFFEYEVEAEPNDAMLSVSLFKWKWMPAEGGLDESVADGGTDGGNGVDMGFSISCMEGATLDSGDSPSSYLRAKKLLSSPSPSRSELGELASVSAVFRFDKPARERLWRTSVTGVTTGKLNCETPSEVESRGERGGEDRAMDLADAVSPSEKCGSSWSSSSWSRSMRKRELSGEGSGVWSSADDMASCQVYGRMDTVINSKSKLAADRQTTEMRPGARQKRKL